MQLFHGDGPMELDVNAKTALELLRGQGYEAYVVGGCVRDGLMGVRPKDWDVCTSALPEEVLQCFRNYHTIETGLQHGTVTVVIGRTPIEVTTYRVDGSYADHRRPNAVQFVRSLREDLARRDFTMNAIAYHPAAGLVDPYHGARDIRDKIIRCVGDPVSRFQEDGLRIMRALRFAARLGFSLDEATSDGIHRSRELLCSISAERLADELCGMLEGAFVRDVLLAFPDVLGTFIPEIRPMIGFAQNNPYHQYDVWRHTVESVAAAPGGKVLRLAMLFHDSGKPSAHAVGADGIDHFHGHAANSVSIATAVLGRLRLDKETVSAVTELIRWHDVPIEPGGVVRWLNRLGEERFDQLLAVKAADVSAQAQEYRAERLARLEVLRHARDAIREERRCFQLKDLAVNGRDLIALGAPQGPRLGEMLDALLAQVMDGRLPNEKEALLKAAQRLMS